VSTAALRLAAISGAQEPGRSYSMAMSDRDDSNYWPLF